MNYERIIADLIEDEGEILHAYQDTLGLWTIGVGVLIDQKRGGGITHEESAYLLANRVKDKQKQLIAALPWVGGIPDEIQAALLNMAYQLGVNGLVGFKNSLELIRTGKYQEAGVELAKSTWFKQTPNRAARVIKQIVTGEHRHGG